MSQHTGIAWTDHTFNPWWGCFKVSPAAGAAAGAAAGKKLEPTVTELQISALDLLDRMVAVGQAA